MYLVTSYQEISCVKQVFEFGILSTVYYNLSQLLKVPSRGEEKMKEQCMDGGGGGGGIAEQG